MTFTTPDILIVEDEELNRDIMARRLQSSEYHLRFAEDGQQALDQVAEKRELLQQDGIHPTAEAQPQIMMNIWKGLQPLLDQR